ncbi:MAG: STAS domain-containing protein [Terracidiphilus sp.]|jgi:anti-anti-sigma factor
MSFDSPLIIERTPGNNPGTLILRLRGALTLAAILQLRTHFRAFELSQLTILDLAAVPYVDSAGLSEIVNHEIYCRDKKVRLILAGLNRRVLDMLKTTHLDKVLNLKPTVEEAEANQCPSATPDFSSAHSCPIWCTRSIDSPQTACDTVIPR